MEQKRITLLLPSAIVEAAEQAAAARGITRHNYLCGLIVSAIDGAGEDENAAKLREIAALQRVSISILARAWGERNPQAAAIIRGMMADAVKN